MNIMPKITTVHVVKKLNDYSPHVIETCRAVGEFFWLNFNISEVPIHQITASTLIVSVGGDGTMLYAAGLASKYNCYVAGFNLGKLGFITTDLINHSITDTLDALTTNNFVQNRMVLAIDNYIAVNEFLFQPRGVGMPLHRFALRDKKQNKLITKYNASGVVVSTPTGSTAFAISLGGSILAPDVRAIEVLPLAAHSLMQGAHPIILADDIELEIQTENSNVDVIADGQVVNQPLTLPLVVKIAPSPAKFVHIEGWDFFDVLTQKMGWQ